MLYVITRSLVGFRCGIFPKSLPLPSLGCDYEDARQQSLIRQDWVGKNSGCDIRLSLHMKRNTAAG